MTFLSKISKEEIAELPKKQFEGEIRIVQSTEGLSEALGFLSQFEAVGFDTESKPSFKKGKNNKVALLQLSTVNLAYLIRMNCLGLPDILLDFLMNDQIKKIGVAINDDMHELRRLKSFEPGGFIDLQKMVEDYGIEDKSLKKLAANILGIRISKSQRLSNWENGHLSEAQQRYAATDAWVCLEIYNKLIEMG